MRWMPSIALLLAAGLAGPVSAQNPPQGLAPEARFQAQLPAGWVTRVQGERVTYQGPGAAFSVMPRPGTDARAALQALVQQVAGAWRQAQPGEAGEVQIDGRPSRYQELAGLDPSGIPSFGRVTMVQGSAGLVAIVATSSQQSMAANAAAFTQLHKTLRLGAPTAPAATAAQGTAPAAGAGAFQVLPHQAGSGTALVRRGVAEKSARALAQQTLPALAGVLDRAPRSLGGMASKEDNAAMLSFAGHQRGALVQGYVVAQTGPRGGTVVVAIDDPARLSRSGPLLLAAADPPAATGPDPYRNATLQPVSFGSGQVSLPPGWRVLGQAGGAVDIGGPRGEALSLGVANPVLTPAAAQQMMAGGIPVQMYVAPATQDPLAAFRAVQPQIEKMILRSGGAVVRMGQVRESERIAFGNMAAALVASDGTGADGRPYRKLALVAAGPELGNGSWLYYTSEVYAPADLYPQALPLMLKIWNSWTVDKSVLMERLVSAAKTLRETNEIVSGGYAARQASQDRLSEAWGHHLRGTVVVNDANTGRNSTEWLYQPGPAANGIGVEHNRHMTNVVRDANQAAGFERWQIVNP